MIRLFALPGKTSRTLLSTEQIPSVQSSTSRIEPEDGDAEFVRPVDSLRQHAMAHEDQPPASVGRRNRCRSGHLSHVEVATLIVDPRKVTRTVEVARLNRSSGGHDRVCSAEVDHPLAAQFDCFIVRSATRLRLWRLPFHGTSLPETAVLVTRDAAPEDEMSALARSLAPLTSSRRKATIGDWS